MPRRRRVPVVGTRGLNTAQLSPEARRIAARRSKRAARREYAPVIRADRQAIGAVNAGYRSQAQSIRGATGAVQNSLSQALRGLRGSGLSGGYKRQVQNEIASRQQDAAQSIPFLLADAAQERGEGITAAKQQIAEDVAARDQSAASKFNQALKEERDAASTVVGDRRKKEKEPVDEGLNNAAIALRGVISEWKADPEKRESNPLSSERDWVDLAKFMTDEYEGVSLSDAAKVIQRLRGRWAKDESRAVKGVIFKGVS